ncbi:KTSC domain-containing protein [Burkholderia cepacia]|uniref:KTSC domain-containing protein n=1 Tax=Burkholderia cepacia TaxID=292 RepID=UPI0029907F35|nr:KTSC domain-containing protein [Burkholderia cepacia]MDW9245202.1 KTSC domain protein [Burkholderia cepacia]
MNTNPIPLQAVESSQIFAIGHDAATNTLAIRFKNRSTGAATSLYHYENVDAALFAEFAAAESKGSFFGQRIKPFKELFPYVQIEKMPATAQETV